MVLRELRHICKMLKTFLTLNTQKAVSYASIFRQSEFEHSKYTFEVADTELMSRWFNDYEQEAGRATVQKNWFFRHTIMF